MGKKISPLAARAVLLVMTSGSAWAQQGHDTTPADVEEGLRNFMNSCATCHGPDGDAMPGADLSRPALRQATTDQEITRIILTGIPGTPMPPSNLNQRQVATLVAFIHSLGAARGRQTGKGDPARGRAIFEGKGNCINCHRVNGKGSRFGPELSDIGATRRAAELEESLLDPDAVILPQNRLVTVVTRTGGTVRGRLLNQDTQSIQMMGAEQRPVSFLRDSLRSITFEPKSPMPSYKSRWTPAELADVVSYLISLKESRLGE